MPTAQKSAVIEQLQETFDGAAAIFLADFTGLNVEKITDLRRKCRENGVHFQVIKNTLAIKAMRKLSLNELEEHFQGPTALAVSTEDPTSPARVLIDFQKEHEKPQVKLGFVDGRVLNADEVKALANLPTRDQLIAQVMQLALAPAQNFVGVLNEVLSKLVRTVDAVRDGKEKGTIASAEAADEASAETTAEPASEPSAEATAEADGGADAESEETTEAEESPAAEEGEQEEAPPTEESAGS
jgi:large subunit ribosomal protein L10